MEVVRRLPSGGKKKNGSGASTSPLVLEKSDGSCCSRLFDRNCVGSLTSTDATFATNTQTSYRSLGSLESTTSRLELCEKEWWMVSGTSMEKSRDGATPPPLPSVPRHLRRDVDSKNAPHSAPSSPTSTDVRRSLPPMPNSPPTPTRSLSYGNLRRRDSPTPRSPGGIGDPSSPSPRRSDRVVEFPNGSSSSGDVVADSSTEGRRQSSPLHSPQLRRRKLRSSIGSSDLTKAQPLVARRGDVDGDSEGSGGGNEIDGDRDHFIVDTEMAFRRESNNDIRLNQYEMGKPIGRGAYGTVIEARNVYDHKKYAVKVMSKRKLKKAAFGHRLGKGSLETVRKEIAILKKVRHRNVVKLFEVINAEDESDMYLVFELVEHGQVLEVNQGECLSEERAWDYFIDLLLGVEYLHSLGVVHRDIKPSNLLIDGEDRLKIADFGVSEMFEKGGSTRLSKTAGSPAFMAPEMLIAEPGDTIMYEAKPLDIWSMGVTLYCWIYGQCPFWPERPNDMVELQDRITSEELAFPDEPVASEDVKHLLTRLLEKNPSNRIRIPEIRRHPWVMSRLGNVSQSFRLEEKTNFARFSITSQEIRDAVRQNTTLSDKEKTTVVSLAEKGRRERSPGSDEDSAFQSSPPSRDLSSSSLLSSKTSFTSSNRRSPPTEDEDLSRD